MLPLVVPLLRLTVAKFVAEKPLLKTSDTGVFTFSAVVGGIAGNLNGRVIGRQRVDVNGVDAIGRRKLEGVRRIHECYGFPLRGTDRCLPAGGIRNGNRFRAAGIV